MQENSDSVAKIMLPVQSKMARAALGLGVRELAKLAGVSINTITRLERGEDLKATTALSIRTALEAAGVEFSEMPNKVGISVHRGLPQ